MPNGALRPWGCESWPTVVSETIVDLVIPVASLSDPVERDRFLKETEVEMLPSGVEVRFRISGSKVPVRFSEFVIDGSDAYPDPGPMASVFLAESLKLKLRPNRRSKLCDVTCEVPSLKAQASSLNEAYTLLSEALEPHRRSHGGSVYLQGYYLDEGRWIQLDALRRWLEAGRPTPIRQQ
jgi:hypothetical protein